MTKPTPELQRLRDAADAAYKVWKRASAEQKVKAWQDYENAEAKYLRTLYKSEETR